MITQALRFWDNSILLILRDNSFIKGEPLPIWWYWVETKGDKMVSAVIKERNKHQHFKELKVIKDKEQLLGITPALIATYKMGVQLR